MFLQNGSLTTKWPFRFTLDDARHRIRKGMTPHADNRSTSRSQFDSGYSYFDSDAVSMSDFLATRHYAVAHSRQCVRDAYNASRSQCHVRDLIAFVRNLIAVLCPRMALRWRVATPRRTHASVSAMFMTCHASSVTFMF